MTKIKVLIIDDEPPARDIIRHFLSTEPEIEIAGECENGFDALKMINELKPDLIFLDVQMPKLTGFELLELLPDPPQIVFTTAYDEFAIKAFEMNAVDYLLKPFAKTRLLQALERARQRLDAREPEEKQHIEKLKSGIDDSREEIDRVVTRLGSKIIVIPVDKIWYIEAQDDYVMIYSELGNHLKEKTMKYFETHLAPKGFIRIHRSHLVNVTEILSVELYGKDTHLVKLKCGAKLKTSAEGYKRLRELL
ncbi:MAG: DNA-binding response regulator [Bacteroidetes bacterium HGW-Bacteroidetes-9]|jgi:two-component system LytT family response regulator|nr:MAG: DNA-binding response regulator [Bacteroidetes bacterium HGW-Bacteroidetes-9]